MFVFHDAQMNVLSLAYGDPEMIPADAGPYIEMPDQEFQTLLGLKIIDNQVVRDTGDASYQDSLRRRIDIERDRRMKAGFLFGGVAYDFDDASKARITGMATLAGFAMGQGAQAGNYHWHGGTDPFVWIASDNSFVPMDAPTCFAFGQAAAAHEIAFIFAARLLKDMVPVPENFTDPLYWPGGVS